MVPFTLEFSPKEGSSLFHHCQLPYNVFHNTLPQNFTTGSGQQSSLSTRLVKIDKIVTATEQPS